MIVLTSFGATGDGTTNDSAALAAAIAACGAGETIWLRPGDVHLIDPGIQLPGGVKFAGSGAFKPTHQIGMNTFICSEGDNAFYDTRFIGTGKASVYDGFAFISIKGARDVKAEGIRITEGRGTGIRIADSKNIILRDVEMDVGSNAITLNDDVIGSDWIVAEEVRATVGCIGFGAESDDAEFVVSNVFVKKCRFTRGVPVAGDNYAAGVTKSAGHGAGSFKKYRNIVFEDIYADGFTTAFPVRGTSTGVFKNLVTRNCDRSMNLSAGNPCEDISIESCDLASAAHGVVFAGPSDRLTVRDCRITIDSGLGVNLHACSRVNIRGNEVLVSNDGGASTGIRATISNGQVSNNVVRKAATPFNLSNGGGASLFLSNNNATAY